jgi:hypothetical protein
VEPNPAAIAWYVEEAQRLLEEQQRRAESLRTRGGQLAGFGETQEDGNAAAGAIMISLYALLTGLGFSLLSLGTLIFDSI